MAAREQATAELTAAECRLVVSAIRQSFDSVAKMFDTSKYPEAVYRRIRLAFKTPNHVRPDDLRDALYWKFGHLGKEGRIPTTHRKLISELQRAWPRLVRDLPDAPDQTFALINDRVGGPTRFITTAFVVHLIHPSHVPIIDQHNFRAVNSLIQGVRPSWTSKKKPSSWSDIVLVHAFMSAVRSAWRHEAPATTPTLRRLDQFLMRYGKDIKRRHNQRLHPTAAVDRMRVSGRG